MRRSPPALLTRPRVTAGCLASTKPSPSLARSTAGRTGCIRAGHPYACSTPGGATTTSSSLGGSDPGPFARRCTCAGMPRGMLGTVHADTGNSTMRSLCTRGSSQLQAVCHGCEAALAAFCDACDVREMVARPMRVADPAGMRESSLVRCCASPPVTAGWSCQMQDSMVGYVSVEARCMRMQAHGMLKWSWSGVSSHRGCACGAVVGVCTLFVQVISFRLVCVWHVLKGMPGYVQLNLMDMCS